MHILIVNNTCIPALAYGGTERVIWWLGKQLVNKGHKVSYLVKKGSYCPFASIIEWKENAPLSTQIPEDVDLIHLHYPSTEVLPKPCISTIHGYCKPGQIFRQNTVFVGKKHAEIHKCSSFVHNGLDVDEYGSVNWQAKREAYLFLGKAKLKTKNVDTCKQIAKNNKIPLNIVGGRGFSFSPYIHYKGMLGGDAKNKVINSSLALLFPVRWHEPFGLAITESLYFGCPAFGTSYGSLPELIIPEVGFLSNDVKELTEAAKNYEQYNRKTCHQYVADTLSSVQMTEQYLHLYEKIMNGEHINSNPPLSPGTKAEYLPIY